MSGYPGFGPSSPLWSAQQDNPRPPAKLSTRIVTAAVEDALIDSFTRLALDTLLPEELGLTWSDADTDPTDPNLTKRDVVRSYTTGWSVPQLIDLARRLTTEVELKEHRVEELQRLIDADERGGGVAGPTKNLIFAANGPKPEIVLRDAVSNDIQIVANAEFCLVYDQPVQPEGLRFSHLVAWWREREGFAPEVDDHAVGRALHQRLGAALDSPAERVVFDAYARRYKDTFDIPALIPQVYLHYDPYDQRTRRASDSGAPLARQRMDFLLLFSARQRVVIEVDGKQHYADGSVASPKRYSEMVAEDRRLRLTGYEVYRFGGYELTQGTGGAMVGEFFDRLADRMK